MATDPQDNGAEEDVELFPRNWVARRDVPQSSDKFKMTIMNWNVLADGLNGLHGEKSKTFANVPRQFLELSHRGPLMVKEIAYWDCDIICFQEFDLYKDENFMREMRRLGYAEAVRQTKRWSPCITINPQLAPDGVSIFYKTNMFEQGEVRRTDQGQHKRWIERNLTKNRDAIMNGRIHLEKIAELMGDDGPKIARLMKEELKTGELDDATYSEAEGSVKIESINRWLNTPKPPVSAGVILHPKARPNLQLYIMTTHLVASKKLKGEQQRISELKDLLEDPNHTDLMASSQTFLCFDMNASFEAINGYSPLAYPFLVGSTPSNADMHGHDIPEPQPVQFKSATRDYDHGDSEMTWSSWKKRVTDDGVQDMKYGVDFVFYPPTGWNVTRVSSQPNEEEMQRSAHAVKMEFGLESDPTPLPNKRYPSDHISVCVELQMN